jgi:dTDP-4-dehydrorhamnose reductase
MGASLIIGADGRIGRALLDKLAADGAEALGTSRRRPVPQGCVFFDLAADPAGWVLPHGVDAAFLCAAIAALESCRQDPQGSRRVNVSHTVLLARQLAAEGAFVIFLSTNRVFDGSIPYRRATDPVCPTTEYGRQKAEAERQLLDLGDQVAIVRLSKVLSPGLFLFTQWRKALERGEPIYPFSDVATAAISLPFAVEVLCRVAEVRRPGIFQVSSDREVTYAQAAERLAARIGVCPKLVRPTKVDGMFELSGSPPQYATMDCTRMREELGLEPPDVWQAIDLATGAARPADAQKEPLGKLEPST